MRHRVIPLPFLLASAFALVAFVATPARAETFALAIGINEYDHLASLKGARADAQDITAALSKTGASVTTLLDRDATRERIEAAWKSLVAKARSGDTVIFAYAGHGGQEKDKAPFDEEDKRDEAFLLSTFNPDPKHPGFDQRILDDTFYKWLLQAAAKGLKVVVIADSCYSGGATRGTDLRGEATTRNAPPYDIPDEMSVDQSLDQIKEDAEKAEKKSAQLPPGITVYSATLERLPSPEIMIDGQKRGALSYVFSRALEGEADINQDGWLSRFEVQAHSASHVPVLAESRQTPEMQTLDVNKDELIIPLTTRAIAPPKVADSAQVQTLVTTKTDTKPEPPVTPPIVPLAKPSASAEPGTLNLKIVGMDAAAAKDVFAILKGVTPAEGQGTAALVFDAAKGDVISDLGDPIAHGVTKFTLQGVVDKWRALAVLKRMMSTRNVDFTLLPDNRRHEEKSKISVRSAPLPAGVPYVTVIVLQPDGTLNLIYPLSKDESNPWKAGTPYEVADIDVTKPFGADHVLLIASSKPLAQLHADLKKLSAAKLPDRLNKDLKGMEFRLGLQGIYTCAAPCEDKK